MIRTPLRAPQFTTAAATQPGWYRVLNRIGRVLPRGRSPSADELFAAAARRERSAMAPRPDTVAALTALGRSLYEDAALSFAGRAAARADCLRMARQHLAIEQALRDEPAIRNVALPAPIFLVGWMRTGTTFVHRLLACDPDTRTMPYWESMYPVPPRGRRDDRPERLTRVLGQLERIAPSYQAIHSMSAHDPEECVALFTNVFRTLQYNVQYRVPGYVAWLLGEDPRVAYGQYRRQLQLVQHHRPHGVRFALKDPTHSVFLETILELFPDARFVFTHRDPVTTLSSLASLYAYTRAIFSDDVDPRALGPELLDGYLPASLERALAIADGLPAGRVAHVRHADVRRDPVGAMARAYADLGLAFGDAARERMQAMLTAEERGPRNVHVHEPTAFGLDPDEVRERFAAYAARFDL
jgi:hypothetical protein